MRVEDLTNVDALLFIMGLIGFSWLFYRLIPSPNQAPVPRTHFSEEEIKAYDYELPKYFLVAALALTLGGLHTVIKNLPGFWQWLWEAGYGGHLFRDLSNSHIIIVGGGTVMLTALTWYALPRYVNRPLYSKTLAGMSFWFTLIGVFGFYVSWLVLGLIEGSMVRHGWDYLAAKDAIGNLHKIPTGITSGIMGLGYWTYVANVFLTAFAARHIKNKPHGHLTKFAMVSAGALFLGTVQGVLQVLPKNADWIRHAGKFGEYVDPISHAHINLVTGMMVSLAAFLVFFGPRMSGGKISRRAANRIFAVLVPGSLLFYFSFLLLGLTLGGAVNGEGGIQSAWLTAFFSHNIRLILALAGSFMLAGFWVYFFTLWRSFGLRDLKTHIQQASPAAFWLLSSLALVVGTFQGMLQVIPATASILTLPEEVPNIHAQLNMIGGVILALIGVVYLLLPELLGEAADRKLRRFSLIGIASGIGGYYLVTLSTGLLRYVYMQQGMTSVQAAEHLGWAAPVFLVLTALPMLAGYLAFGLSLWRLTVTYRAEWWASIKGLPGRYNAPLTGWRRRIPRGYYLVVEAVGAIAGFPGLGWIMSGQAFPGVPMAMAGPAIAWAAIPIMVSPYGNGPLVSLGNMAIVVYLSISTFLSVGLLWITLLRRFTPQEAEWQR